MSEIIKLAAPIVDNSLAAHTKANKDLLSITVPFLLNRAVGWSQIKGVSLIVKTVQTGTQICYAECLRESLIYKEGKYFATFQIEDDQLKHFKEKQTYKVQIAFISSEGYEGYYSSVATFKLTYKPTLVIEGLSPDKVNAHIATYSGTYTNEDQNERVYSYRFDLYNESGSLVATSGEQLHNSSKDTLITSSTDEWTTKYSLENEKSYTVIYKVTTTNGLECESQAYRIYNGMTFDSNIVKYCDLVATLNSNEAYVELSLKPKQRVTKDRYISGQFIVCRASSEDNYSTWHEMTRFMLSSHSILSTLFICRDYCVSQGVGYKYAIQAYSSKGGVYANRQLAIPQITFVDFEDMFLSDGERQLKIKFNPKVSSFKNTLLESKMDTLGGKYPFFFRNGNTSYKEFPISGLISMMMDENESFMNGIILSQEAREKTPADQSKTEFVVPTNLTGDTIRREREFKMEVLHWLINGEPKLFRSPTEGSYIVRLMNTSLSPNDTLGRMLHTFSTTAYEIDDFTFENLRKYNMMIDEYVEMRELEFKTIYLDTNLNHNGVAKNLNACVATLTTAPHTILRYRLKNDNEGYQQLEVGGTGIYIFPTDVLAGNELMEIAPPVGEEQSRRYWPEGTTLNYATYAENKLVNFSNIHSIDVTDKICTFIGDNNKTLLERIEDKYKIRITLGNIYYLKVSARPITVVDGIDGSLSKNRFYIGSVIYDPSPQELIRYGDAYYDGGTGNLIGTYSALNFNFKLYSGEDTKAINLGGTLTANGESLNRFLGLEDSQDKVKNVNGCLILTNIDNADLLQMGNGLYADIAYQEIVRLYTVEINPESEIYKYKKEWEETESVESYNKYYEELYAWCNTVEGDTIIDAI